MPDAEDPIARFQQLFARASDHAPFDPVAVTLATVGPGGHPSARIVLLRRVDDRGFGFFTNYLSRKGRELTDNPHAAICAYWPWIDEQVRIEGRVISAAPAESDEYFAARPRGSQIGAWASQQSADLATREALETRYRALEAEYAGREVPRPPHWGGYRLVADRIEFWRAGSYRLHDRNLYERTDTGWRMRLLYP